MADDFALRLKFGSRSFSDPGAGIDAVIKSLQGTWQGEASVVADAMRDYLNNVAKAVVARNSGAFAWGSHGTGLSRRTGRSMDSVLRSVKVSGASWDRLTGSIGGNASLMIHETGGTVRSK